MFIPNNDHVARSQDEGIDTAEKLAFIVCIDDHKDQQRLSSEEIFGKRPAARFSQFICKEIPVDLPSLWVVLPASGRPSDNSDTERCGLRATSPSPGQTWPEGSDNLCNYDSYFKYHDPLEPHVSSHNSRVLYSTFLFDIQRAHGVF